MPIIDLSPSVDDVTDTIHLPPVTDFGRFFLPGPTEVHPDVLAAMTRPVIGHRGSELSTLLAGVDPVLRDLFRTTRPVYVASASATGLMEAAVRNGVRTRSFSSARRRPFRGREWRTARGSRPSPARSGSHPLPQTAWERVYTPVPDG